MPSVVVVASTVVPLAAMSRTVTPGMPFSPTSAIPLSLASSHTRLPSDSGATAAGTTPMSIVWSFSPAAPVV